MLTPGIYTAEHIAGWKLIADAVHAAGSRLYLQLMHVGRIAHPTNTPHGRQPVAPSAIKPKAEMFTAQGMLDIPEPRAMSIADIEEARNEFRHAAACAIAAGADGVEIHGANGYLVHQFLSENANQRIDDYGGTITNRVRFAVEVAAAGADEIGADRTGMRISPANPFNDIVEGDTRALYHELVSELAPPEAGVLARLARRRRRIAALVSRRVAYGVTRQSSRASSRRHRGRYRRRSRRRRDARSVRPRESRSRRPSQDRRTVESTGPRNLLRWRQNGLY